MFSNNHLISCHDIFIPTLPKSLNPTNFADLVDFSCSATVRFMFVGVKWDVNRTVMTCGSHIHVPLRMSCDNLKDLFYQAAPAAGRISLFVILWLLIQRLLNSQRSHQSQLYFGCSCHHYAHVSIPMLAFSSSFAELLNTSVRHWHERREL